MFERKIMKIMIQWKQSGLCNRKALVIKGLRQVGKTFSVREFARQYYNNEVYINFKNNESLKAVFEDDLVVDRLTMDISAVMPGTKFIPGDTLIIFDEVQECTNARASIKAFVEDGRYHVVCTGSLLGIRGYNYKKGKGVPTGFERIVYMYPMDFEEFLWAKGVNAQVIEYLKSCYLKREPVRESVHKSIMRYFREYLCVGGLPAIVREFLETNNMCAVRAEQL